MIVPVGDIAAMSPADRQNLVRVRNWAADKEMEMIGNAVFLVTTDIGGLHETIRAATSRFEQIAIPYPELQRPDVVSLGVAVPEDGVLQGDVLDSQQGAVVAHWCRAFRIQYSSVVLVSFRIRGLSRTLRKSAKYRLRKLPQSMVQ